MGAAWFEAANERPGVPTPLDAAERPEQTIRRLQAENERLRAQVNCGEGHDPARICCTHATDVKRMRSVVRAAAAWRVRVAATWGPHPIQSEESAALVAAVDAFAAGGA